MDNRTFVKSSKTYNKPISECSTEENKNGYCERDIALAFNLMPDEFTIDQLMHEMSNQMAIRLMNKMVEDEYADMLWDEKTGEPVIQFKEGYNLGNLI